MRSTIDRRRRSKPKRRPITSSFLLLSCSQVALVAASTAGNGILPPPPPPPPPRNGISSNISQSILSVENSDVSDHLPDDASSTFISAQSGQETELQNSDEKKQIVLPAYERKDSAIKADTLSTKQTDGFIESQGQQNAWDSYKPSAEKETDGSSESQGQQNAWDSYQAAGSSDATKQTEQQQTQSQYAQQNWGYQQQQPSSQYQDQYYPGQWQQSPQAYYQQQPQQHRQPYSQYQTTAQSQQLIHYNRPQPQSAKASASRLFSLAVRKIQTGIDTVSESLDSNKVASSVSSLTSRLGDVVSSGVGLAGSRGGQPLRPRPMGAGAGMMQRQYDPRQRIDPRRGAGPKQEYAPPMSELFSLDMNAQADEGDDAARVSDGVGDGDDWKGYEERMHDKQLRESETTQHPEQQSQHPDLQHETETDDDSEISHAGSVPDMFEAQSQLALMSPKVGTSIPRKASGFRQPQQMRQGPPRGQRPLPRVTPKNRMTDSWPNGGSMASSSPSRRQYTYYDDDNESIGSKVKSVIGSVPVPHIPRFFKGKGSWVDSYDDSAWSDYESKEKTKSQSASTVGSSLQGRRASMGSLNNAAVPRPVMSLLGKRNSLVSSAGARRCASVGRTQAILDAGQLALIVFSFHEILPTLHNAVSANAGYLRSAMLSTILSSIDGWAPYALCAAFLLSASNSAWIKPSLKALLSEVAAESEAESAYSQLYLRLISSIPMKKSFPDVVRKAARAEALNTIAASRLHFFTTLAVAYVLLSTVAVLKPAGSAMMSAAVHSIKLDAWKATPIVWSTVLEQMKTVGLDLVRSLRSLFYTELEEVRQQPLRVVVVLSLLATLMLVSYLPSLERSRKGNPKGSIEDDEAEDTISSLWSAIGSSSATRIGILSSPRGVEGALDQFSKLRPDRAACAGMLLLPQGNAKLIKMKRKQQRPPLILRSVKPLFREVAYLVSSILALLVPLAIYTYVWAKPDSAEGALSFKTIPIDGWTSLVDLAALLFMTNIQLGRAAHYAIGAADARLGTSLTTFFRTLSSTVDELQNLAASSANSDFQSMLTASPTEGVVITDLWAAHSTRKAWAVKGANVKCKNGEVVLIIGSDGAGKSRLLTSISEHIFAPPKSARTTTYVRGSIKVAGVDLSKWDRNQLQRRVGVWLNDVRTVSDYASLFTGCTLEEILEPIPLVGGASRQTGAKEKSALALAMKITGLGSKLSTRLPSKLSTVVSANEDELKPSPLRPPSYPLSPSDWSRVLLTKVLAQLIAGNDNQQSSPNNIAKCLVGSTLLLDDATSQMSEVDEAHCITALRSTGAAVILTSNRWATGRFSDRIVVIENGSVIESGTHADLINLGPERSLYARQWNNMASI